MNTAYESSMHFQFFLERFYCACSFFTQVLDAYIFAFWAKTSVDPEPRRIRLKSNSYTTNNILDTVTAASIQVGRFLVSYYSLIILLLQSLLQVFSGLLVY